VSALCRADGSSVPVVTAVDLEPGATFPVALGIAPPYDSGNREMVQLVSYKEGLR